MSDDSTQNSSGAIDPAAPAQLARLVDYAPGSVVSRTLVKSKSGTMTVFAFDVGEELSEHTAPFDAYVQVLDGTVELSIGGEKVAATVGDLVRMPADIPHAVRAVERFKMLLTLYR